MGIYNFSIGKGIILTSQEFYDRYKDQCNSKDFDITKPSYVLGDIIQEIIKECVGDFKVVSLGHDAFNYDNPMGVFDRTPNAEYIRKGSHPYGEEDLFFIGINHNLDSAEYNYNPSAPEMLYGLAAFMDEIVEIYPKLKASDCTALSDAFDRKACIWTYACDCICCG